MSRRGGGRFCFGKAFTSLATDSLLMDTLDVVQVTSVSDVVDMNQEEGRVDLVLMLTKVGSLAIWLACLDAWPGGLYALGFGINEGLLKSQRAGSYALEAPRGPLQLPAPCHLAVLAFTCMCDLWECLEAWLLDPTYGTAQRPGLTAADLLHLLKVLPARPIPSPAAGVLPAQPHGSHASTAEWADAPVCANHHA